VEERHVRFGEVLKMARAAVPSEWRRALVRRADFDRVLFGPEDVTVAVGQDGLAEYLDGQPVLGVNSAPDRYDGVLVRITPDRIGRLLPACRPRRHGHRTMAEALLDSDVRLLAPNEIFVGHRSHQSARYRISVDGAEE